MKTIRQTLKGYGLLASWLFLLFPASASAGTLALQEDNPVATLGNLLFVYLLVGLVGYIYLAVCLSAIAEKTHTDNAWYAWIPILNLLLMLSIAGRPGWWILLLLFIPVLNIVIFIIVWMNIAEARGKPSWWGLLLIVPLVNFLVPAYLAFSD